MGNHVLTLALGAVKHATGGKPPEDSATGEQDTDLQEAGVLDRTRRASRSLAKMRRDQWRTHRERWKDDVEDCDLAGERWFRSNRR